MRHPLLQKWTAASPPPVTITGVAPWAFSGRGTPALGGTHGTSPHSFRSVALQGGGGPSQEAMFQQKQQLLPPAPPPPPPPSSPWERYRLHIEALNPQAPSASSAVLPPSTGPPLPPCLASAPTLLPHLAFHDLVFVKELGKGSFARVWCAKHIQRGPGAPPSSQWPSYAIKSISAACLKEKSYTMCAERELRVLSALAHPGTTRLASAYRWRGEIHFALEFGGRGDLHSHLDEAVSCGAGGGGNCRDGGLEEGAARFLAAQVACALGYLHTELGLAYGDCKPENIVLVEGGEGRGVHAKLTDFGACRPLGEKGAAMLRDSRGILLGVRDGEWRKPGCPVLPVGAADTTGREEGVERGKGGGGEQEQGLDSEAEEVDDRVEGTLEYLAPELCGGGGAPSVASDMYAFGLTVYQMLSGGGLPDVALPDLWPPAAACGGAVGGGSGRTPLAAAAAAAAAGGGVTFNLSTAGKGGCAFPPSFPPLAAHLVRALLHPDPQQRLGGGAGGVREVLEHPWFTASSRSSAAASLVVQNCRVQWGEGLWGLRGPTLPGSGAPGAGAGEGAGGKWSRRHASSIWAPLQAAGVPQALSAVASFSSTATPPLDGRGGGGEPGRPPPSLYTLMNAVELPHLI